MGQVVGGPVLDGLPRGGRRRRQRVGLKAESLPVLLGAEQRQHRPGVGIPRRLDDGQLQARPRRGEFLGRDALEVAEAAQHGFVRAQLLGRAAAQLPAHAPGQHPVHVGHRRDDPRHQVVLQLEQRVRAERAFVGLGPQVGPGRHVDELDRDAQLRPRLPQAPLHHVAGADRLAGIPGVLVLGDRAHRRAARDDPEVRETGQPGDDLLGQPLGQRREVGVGAGDVNGSTATQKPSSVRAAPEPGAATARGASGARGERFSPAAQLAQLVGDVARRLDALARVLLEAAPDDARQVAGQVGADLAQGPPACRAGSRRRSRPTSRPWNGRAPRHLVEQDARARRGRCGGRPGRPRSARATCTRACPSRRPPPGAAPRSAWRRPDSPPRSSFARPKSSTFTRAVWRAPSRWPASGRGGRCPCRARWRARRPARARVDTRRWPRQAAFGDGGRAARPPRAASSGSGRRSASSTEKTVTMFGWSSAARAFASRLEPREAIGGRGHVGRQHLERHVAPEPRCRGRGTPRPCRRRRSWRRRGSGRGGRPGERHRDRRARLLIAPARRPVDDHRERGPGQR